MISNTKDQLEQHRVSTEMPKNGAMKREAEGDEHSIQDRYNFHDASFRRHYQLHYHDKIQSSHTEHSPPHAHTYEEFYAPAYRFGYELAEENGNADWASVKEAAEHHWQSNHSSAWHEVADAVHYGWKEQRNPEALRVHHDEDFEGHHARFQVHYADALARVTHACTVAAVIAH